MLVMHTKCFEGSKRRWYLYLLVYIITSLTSGLVYGWPVLRREIREMGSTLSEKSLCWIFTLGSLSTQGNQLFFGMARDRYGTKITTVFSLLYVVSGVVGISLSDPNSAAQLGASLFMIGLGSGGNLCLQPVAALFEGWTGTVLLTLSGAFNLSGLVFIALASLFDDSKIAFILFAGVIMFLVIVASVVLPVGSSFVLPKDATEKKMSEATQKSSEEDLDEDNENAENLPEPHLLPNEEEKCTAYSQIKNVEYIALVAWFSVCVTPLQYYIGSIGFHFESKGDSNGFYTYLFSIIYAFGALICPFLGFIADFFGLGLSQCIGSILCAASFFLLNSNGFWSVQIAGNVFYTAGRMMVYGMFFSNLGKRFGFANFGTLAGLGLLISSLVSLLQYPLIASAAEGNNPLQVKRVNNVCGIIMISMIPYCVWLGKQERKKDHQFS